MDTWIKERDIPSFTEFKSPRKFLKTPELSPIIKNRQVLTSELITLIAGGVIEKKKFTPQHIFRRKLPSDTNKKEKSPPPQLLPTLNKRKILPAILGEFNLSSDLDKNKENGHKILMKEFDREMDNVQTSKKLYTQYCKFNLSKPVLFKRTEDENKARLLFNKKYDSKSMEQFKLDPLLTKRENLHPNQLKSNTAPKANIHDILSTSPVKFRDYREIPEELAQKKATVSTLNRKYYPGLDPNAEASTLLYKKQQSPFIYNYTFYETLNYSDSEDPENLINFNDSNSNENVVLREYSNYITKY